MTSLSSEILVGDMSDWIGGLPEYQQATLLLMLDDEDDPLSIAATWLETTQRGDTAPYGGTRRGVAIFYAKLLVELEKLICNSDGPYAADRAKLQAASGAGSAMVVATASALVAPVLGLSIVLVAPAIAMTFAVLSSTSQATACELLRELIDEQSSDQAPEQE